MWPADDRGHLANVQMDSAVAAGWSVEQHMQKDDVSPQGNSKHFHMKDCS